MNTVRNCPGQDPVLSRPLTQPCVPPPTTGTKPTAPCPQALDATRGRAGQAYVETALAIMLVAFIFLGLFQLSQVFAAREILQHAAQRAARSRTVGFNRWMVHKSMRAAAIPNAGRLLEPPWTPTASSPMHQAISTHTPGALWDFALTSWPLSEQAVLERARIPLYLASANSQRAAYILDYADWPEITRVHYGSAPPGAGLAPSTFETIVSQRFPLLIAMHRAFYAPPSDAAGVDRLSLSGRVDLENHHPLYLEDQGW